MKKIPFIILFALQLYCVKAQSNLAVGIDMSSQARGVSPGYGASKGAAFTNGIGIGVLKSLRQDKVQLKSGIAYKFSSIDFDNMPHLTYQNGEVQQVGVRDMRSKYRYIALPIALHYSVLTVSNFSLQLFGGAEFSCLYQVRYESNSTYDGSSAYNLKPKELYPFADIGISLYFKPSDRIRLFLKPKYSYAFREAPYADGRNSLGINLEAYYSF